MSIPNPVYRYLWELINRLRKKKTEKDLEEIHNIAHHLLTAAKETAVDIRNTTLVVGNIARKNNDLSLWERMGKLDADAVALESAVKAAGGYMKYPDTN